MEETYMGEPAPIDFSAPPVAYCYDHDTGELTGTEICQPDPLESEQAGHAVWLVPANATLLVPPVPTDDHAVQWSGSVWQLVEDHRQKRDKGGVPIEGTGTPYWLPEDEYGASPRYMTELGPLPGNAVLTAPAKSVDHLFDELRAMRDGRLAATDYLLMPDYPITEERKAQVEAYRQTLRDLPAQNGAPWDGGGAQTPWPTMPTL